MTFKNVADETEECPFSMLPKDQCAHCRGDDDSDLVPEDDYEVIATFPSQFGGTCTLEERHRIRKGDRVGKIRYSDNPMLSIPGVACSMCTLGLPRAKK